MIKRLLILLPFFLLISCSSMQGLKRDKNYNSERADYVRSLKAAKSGKSKREYVLFLQGELEKKQGEMHALEGMRHNEENFLSHDEQRDRDITRSSDEQSMFSLGKASRRNSLRDIEQQIRNVQNSIFDIRTLLSEL